MTRQEYVDLRVGDRIKLSESGKIHRITSVSTFGVYTMCQTLIDASAIKTDHDVTCKMCRHIMDTMNL